MQVSTPVQGLHRGRTALSELQVSSCVTELTVCVCSSLNRSTFTFIPPRAATTPVPALETPSAHYVTW